MSDVLEQVFPFRFLTLSERAQVRPRLLPFQASDGDVLFPAGDRGRDVYLLSRGDVQVVDRDGSIVTVIHAGHYFGERASLFDEPRRYLVRAVGEIEGYRLPGDEFLGLFETSPAFAQAFAQLLRQKHGLFAAVDAFVAKLWRTVVEGSLDLDDLLPLYQALDPALHTHARRAEVDYAALSYAVRRLPDNVGATFAWFLTDDVPPIHSDPDQAFRAVPTDARPRSTWEMMPGKSMVLLRDGISDLVDFLSCLCVYAVEARKLRNRLETPETLIALGRGHLELDDIPLSADEKTGLRRVFGVAAPQRLREIAFHHEDYAIRIRRQHHNYNSRHSELWIAQIDEAVAHLIGGPLPEDVPVHVVSSNTHSVRNCLSPWLEAHADDLRAWARQAGHPLAEAQWADPSDVTYAIARDWVKARPDQAAARVAAERAFGMVELPKTAFTGIQVGLVDLSRLVGQRVDPALHGGQLPADTRGIVVNIDFAFGQQAGEILGSLITLFGRRIRTVGVLGKAGALQGARGDMLVPTTFVDQADDGVATLPPLRVDVDRLRQTGRGVHVGPLLTVPGTLLQNRQMLGFYQHLWRAVGLEMEGTHYWRRIDEGVRLGILRPDVAVRFLYYVSDLPLDHKSNLAGRLSPEEGIPPLYAVTREVLHGVLHPAA